MTEKQEERLNKFMELIKVPEDSKTHYLRLYDTIKLMLNKIDKEAIKEEIIEMQLREIADTFLILNPLLGFIDIETKDKLQEYVADKNKVIMEVLNYEKK